MFTPSISNLPSRSLPSSILLMPRPGTTGLPTAGLPTAVLSGLAGTVLARGTRLIANRFRGICRSLLHRCRCRR
jgi:hypothetical protein